MTDVRIIDIIDMPDFNPDTQQGGRGDWGLRSVSSGEVRADPVNVVECVEHGAMNSVSATRTIWRCLTCGRAAYRVIQPQEDSSMTWLRRKWILRGTELRTVNDGMKLLTVKRRLSRHGAQQVKDAYRQEWRPDTP